MKTTHQPKALKLIEKFDKQLRDMLNAELQAVRATRNQLMTQFGKDESLLVA